MTKRPRFKHYVATALLVAPTVGGMFGLNMWFTPNPRLKWIAVGEVALYYAVLLIVLSVLARRGPAVPRRPAAFVGLVAGVALFGFMAFLCAYVTVPSVLTSFYGRPSTRQDRLLSVEVPLPRRARWCRHDVVLERLRPAFGKSFCENVRPTASDVSVGATVIVHGRETLFGFRLEDIDG